ncbi:PilW family protein [Mesobacillus jeotgali]|uniref:PilW family protein n=1 Tax=Mesobacillus jeotgali TaxID=129985 RepID=UPI000C815A1F|nr:type II secretion system protein [Mesobacillus jeotgali]
MNNQKGMSLVELLAVIAILFIISGIIYGVFFTFNNNYDRISQKTSMDQSANLVLATIKQYHQTNDSYWIKYDQSGKQAYIGQDTANHLLGDSLYEMEIKVGYPTTTTIDNLKIDSQHPLSVQLTLTDQKGQKYEVETTVKRY